MIIQENVSLKSYNTFGIDVNAKQFVAISHVEDLQHLLKSRDSSELFILGGGSNMLLTNELDKLVVHLKLKGTEVVQESGNHVYVKVAAGENWHEFVLWCIERNYGGIENLSLIPGNVGAAPIQNIGAYGVELKDVFENCEALELSSNSVQTFSKADCLFEYRNSVFKQSMKGKFVILSLTLKLTKNEHQINTRYGAIEAELTKRGIDNPTIKDISEVVICIRQSKLPDPNEIGNSGSFFKNPVISVDQFEKLKSNFPEVPNYPVNAASVKVPAGWLIEKAGFKGKTIGNYGVHKHQALVLVNYGNAKGSDIYNLATLIQDTVKRIFDINLEAEVNIL